MVGATVNATKKQRRLFLDFLFLIGLVKNQLVFKNSNDSIMYMYMNIFYVGCSFFLFLLIVSTSFSGIQTVGKMLGEVEHFGIRLRF